MFVPAAYRKMNFIWMDGNNNATDANGYVNVPDECIPAMLKIGASIHPAIIPEKFTTLANAANSTIPSASLTGAKRVYLLVSGGAALTHTMEPAANIIAALPQNFQVGDTWILRILNTNSGNLTVANAANTAFNGTVVMATNRSIELLGTYNSTSTITFQNVGFGNAA